MFVLSIYCLQLIPLQARRIHQLARRTHRQVQRTHRQVQVTTLQPILETENIAYVFCSSAYLEDKQRLMDSLVQKHGNHLLEPSTLQSLCAWICVKLKANTRDVCSLLPYKPCLLPYKPR